MRAPAPGCLVGSRVVRTDPLSFLAGCRKRRLNQALSVLSLSLWFPLSVFRLFYFLTFNILLCLRMLIASDGLRVFYGVNGWTDGRMDSG